MASRSTAMLRRAAQDSLCQASARHFQQRAEFLLLRNCGLGPLARHGCIAHSVRQEGHRYRLRRLPADYWITFQF